MKLTSEERTMITEMAKIQAEKKRLRVKRRVEQAPMRRSHPRDGKDLVRAAKRKMAEHHHREVAKGVFRRM